MAGGDLKALRDRLRAASGSDRELDHDLMEAFFERRTQRTGGSPAYSTYWWEGGLGYGSPHEFTGRIDDALALCERKLPDADWDVERTSLEDKSVVFGCRIFRTDILGNHDGEAPTAPLAILLALLEAMIGKETEAEL